MNMLSFGQRIIATVGIKPIRYFIGSRIREQVIPVEGSVLYCDLWIAAEHSGIYVADGQVSNIEVTGLADSEVRWCDAEGFTAKSLMGRKIYVSCDRHGAVGNDTIARGASSHIGEQSFYGLIIKNCHQFSSKCVNYIGKDISSLKHGLDFITDNLGLEREPTLRKLKADARNQLGATKWRLWDWNNTAEDEPEPDWDANSEFFKSQPLNPEFIDFLRAELAELRDYQQEISDENIPEPIRQRLNQLAVMLDNVSKRYDEVKEFLVRFPDTQLTFNDIQVYQTDFLEMTKIIENNGAVNSLTHKMGRAYIAEEIKKRRKVPRPDRSEVHGVYHSADLMRLLPSELINLDNDTTELLFYARLLEHNLMTYELQGTHWTELEETDMQQQRTGPVIACLDTSGSMHGMPMLKAKALLFAIANILKKENRKLHVLLFGSANQLKEFTLEDASNIGGLMQFLQQGFDGGTDFEMPLKRAIEVIDIGQNFQKADILMISDGDCALSTSFNEYFQVQKTRLNCCTYSVLCNGQRSEDGFSDEIVIL